MTDCPDVAASCCPEPRVETGVVLHVDGKPACAWGIVVFVVCPGIRAVGACSSTTDVAGSFGLGVNNVGGAGGELAGPTLGATGAGTRTWSGRGSPLAGVCVAASIIPGSAGDTDSDSEAGVPVCAAGTASSSTCGFVLETPSATSSVELEVRLDADAVEFEAGVESPRPDEARTGRGVA